MTDTFEITKELNAYFCDKQTQAAVNFVAKSSDSSWLDISVNEFKNDSPENYMNYAGYKNYSDAWLYSMKVQKDLFDFMANVWAKSWATLICNNFNDKLQPESFDTVEDVWEEDEWSRHFSITPNDPFDELWLYCEFIRGEKQSHLIRLKFSLGKDEDYKMTKLSDQPKDWLKTIDKKDNDGYFTRDFTFNVTNNQVRFLDTSVSMKDAMKEIKPYLQEKAFKA